ncbi:PREDICTED: protein pitchfork isoform X1 [Myotis brandtii]|uniref:protein pitchfork isoform X1 n=1 Tax=Myotis brandtii TaxID=109478 RepID=UPI0003BB8F26|nr:PREDICTED: protein pitchfork isoform X1 [Myotis brandtii]
MGFNRGGPVVQHPFGTGEEKKIFPYFHPHNLLGNKFLPLRGAPHRGPGCYTTDTRYDWVHNLSKIPTSKKGYTLGARTAVRFKPNKDLTPHPGTYQTINLQEGKQKQSFAPFNVMLPRFMTHSKDMSFPGPDMYNPQIKPPAKVTWPMKFGSPDWAQIPCLQKRTLKAELPSDKDFRRHRNRMAYLSLFYGSEAGSSSTCSSRPQHLPDGGPSCSSPSALCGLLLSQPEAQGGARGPKYPVRA